MMNTDVYCTGAYTLLLGGPARLRALVGVRLLPKPLGPPLLRATPLFCRVNAFFRNVLGQALMARSIPAAPALQALAAVTHRRDGWVAGVRLSRQHRGTSLAP